MRIYDAGLTLHLFEVFPESFSCVKTSRIIEHMPGPFGMEEIDKGEEDAIMAEYILDTASAISLKYGASSALRYIDGFKPARVQRQEMQLFLSA